MHILILINFTVPVDELSWLWQLPIVMLVSWFVACKGEVRSASPKG